MKILDPKQVREEIPQTWQAIKGQISQILIGQQDLLECAMIALISQGHLLIEGEPGLGKTLFVKALSRCLDLDLHRLQCTADLMPSDILGSYRLDEKGEQGQSDFKVSFELGPIFCQLFFVDEINRANPRTQSALLEAMGERQVSIEKKTHILPQPFMVFATQNPLDSEGTYPLPDAQLDRFFFKIILNSPSEQELLQILSLSLQPDLNQLKALLTADQIKQWFEYAPHIVVPQRILQQIAKLVILSRPHASSVIQGGISPRGAQYFLSAMKSRACLYGRTQVNDEDFDFCLLPSLRHRIKLKWEAQSSGIHTDELLKKIYTEMKGSSSK